MAVVHVGDPALWKGQTSPVTATVNSDRYGTSGGGMIIEQMKPVTERNTISTSLAHRQYLKCTV